MEEKKDYKLYLDTATLAGKLMLQNGAEIYRVGKAHGLAEREI